MLRWHLARGVAATLRWSTLPFLLVGAIATPILQAEQWWEDRVREWDPRRPLRTDATGPKLGASTRDGGAA